MTATRILQVILYCFIYRNDRHAKTENGHTFMIVASLGSPAATTTRRILAGHQINMYKIIIDRILLLYRKYRLIFLQRRPTKIKTYSRYRAFVEKRSIVEYENCVPGAAASSQVVGNFEVDPGLDGDNGFFTCVIITK